MDIEKLFGDMSLAGFLKEHMHRLPLAVHGTAGWTAEFASWPTVASIAAVAGADVLLVRDGETRQMLGDSRLEALQSVCRDGWTIRVRQAQKHSDSLGRLAASFEATFRGPVDVHMYVTPPGRRGLSWHYDAEDVFILQAAGEKEYWLRKNTVNPWPLTETMPLDMRYERELMPLSRALLGAGDLLYIPCGYWHRTETPAASADAAISLAVGVTSHAAIDLLPLIRSKLVESLVWRQRLPLGAADDVREQVRTTLSQLAADAARTFQSDEMVELAVQWLARPECE
jgi:50S ribosomal protein L16 3-hydroxylase